MIYLDLDGPTVNWDKGVFKLFGRHPEIKPGQTSADALGIKRSDIWARVYKAGAKWWADLEPQPWARQMYDELCRIDEVVILTSPSHIPSAHMGKAQWMKKFFGGNFRQYIMTNRKDLLAKPGDILIDDFDKNIDAFTKAGGIGIIFPRPWNKGVEHSDRAMEKVLEDIAQVYPRYVPPHLEESADKWA